jgi:hypothetical protein
MLNGKWRDQELGSGTGVWSMSEQVRAGTLKLQDFFEAESCMHRSHGHCMTMGTASTMASMVEALGVGLPGNAAYPAVDGRRNVLARLAGRRIVDMVHEDQKLSSILTRQAFENAIRTLAAIGGSTNAVIHLIAMARRIGVALSVDDFDRLGSEMPCLVNLQPVRPAPDGGLLLRRRHPRGDEGDPRLPAPGCGHRQRQDRGREHRGRAELEPGSDPAAGVRPSRRRPASRCCAATWRRAAR